MKRLKIYASHIWIVALLLCAALSACIDDSFSTDPSQQPKLSTDTLRLGLVFTAEGTPTHAFTIRNPHNKGMKISSLRLRDDAWRGVFRFNVDGIPGREFTDVEIRANDSIFVLVEATLPENGQPLPVEINAPLDITVNGSTSTIVLNALGCDVTRLHAPRIEADTRWDGPKPIQIFDSLIVAPGAKLTVGAGATLAFHAGAYLRVYGSLITEGTPEAPVDITGDRFDQVVGRIPYHIMSGQWGGIDIMPESRTNSLSHTVVRNSSWGIYAQGDTLLAERPTLSLHNCVLRNSSSNVLTTLHTRLRAVGCELAEAAADVFAAGPGTDFDFNHCTFANYYLFSAISGAMVNVYSPDVTGTIANSIIYGNGGAVRPGELFGYKITIRSTLLKPKGSDDDNFIAILWSKDPKFYTVRSDYHFDYRLRPESEAIAVADPALTLPEAARDFYGLERGPTPDLGAYVFVAPEETPTK